MKTLIRRRLQAFARGLGILFALYSLYSFPLPTLFIGPAYEIPNYNQHLIRHCGTRNVKEELSLKQIVRRGKFPNWLRGTFIRNGPAIFNNARQDRVSHWFDGLAMLHSFYIHDGEVNYQSKFLKSSAKKRYDETQDFDFYGFMQTPPSNFFSRFATFMLPRFSPYVENANHQVAKMGQQFYALAEFPLPVAFDPKTLETLGPMKVEDNLANHHVQTSTHPLYDRKEGKSYNSLVHYGVFPAYEIYSVSDSKPLFREKIHSQWVKRPAYMHSFAMSENYFILTEVPYKVAPIDFLVKSLPYIQNFYWYPQLGTEFIIIEKASGDEMLRFNTQAFFTLHHVNAFEKDGKLYVDLIAYDDPKITHSLANYPLLKTKARLKRFSFDLENEVLEGKTLSQENIEMPRINEERLFQTHRYVYGVCFDNDVSLEHGLIKIDTEKGSHLKWRKESQYASEPLFVPRPGATEEDDGVLLSVVLDLDSNTSYLLCLNAQDLKELAIAQLPRPIPFGMHGQFFDAQELPQ